VSLYRKQRRGGLGVTGGGVKEEAEDFIEQLFLSSTHDYILFFTNKGRVYWRKAYEIPQASRQARGKAIVNLLSLGAEEQVSNFLQVKEFDEKHFIVMATKNGIIKKTRLSAYANPRTKGIIAITLKPKDELVSTRLTNGQNEIFLATLSGKAIRFSEKQVREMGRGASGVRGVRFGKKDEVISMEIPDKDSKALTVTTKGFGKKSFFKDYRLQSRGGKGVINVKLTSKNGEVASVLSVKEEDEIILVTTGGMVVRCPVNQIRTSGRASQGVRVIRLKEKDRVANAVRVVAREEEVDEK
jgi:DNA gyrase subunit A